MEGFRFYSPLWFVLVPLVAVALWYVCHPRRQPTAVFSSIAGLRGLPVTFAQRLRRVLPFAYGAGLILLVGALARPQAGRSESRISTEGVAIQMVLDISGSMRAMDFELDGKQESRVNAVKYVFKQFVAGNKALELAGRPDDLVGLVAFGGFADSKCPLTLDHGALQDIVAQLDVAKAIRDRRGRVINEDLLDEEQSTAIGDGLTLALDRLRGVEAKSKVVILLSDGDNNAGVIEPAEAAKIAAKMGIKIYTIGIGQTGYAPVPVEDKFGEMQLVRRAFRLDEDTLKGIAKETGGAYFNATDTEGLARVYAEIDKMEKSKVEEFSYTEYTELYLWPAVPGVALVLLASVLGLTRFRTVP
jgi:Ca-activated chloride channel family protein